MTCYGERPAFADAMSIEDSGDNRYLRRCRRTPPGTAAPPLLPTLPLALPPAIIHHHVPNLALPNPTFTDDLRPTKLAWQWVDEDALWQGPCFRFRRHNQGRWDQQQVTPPRTRNTATTLTHVPTTTATHAHHRCRYRRHFPITPLTPTCTDATRPATFTASSRVTTALWGEGPASVGATEHGGNNRCLTRPPPPPHACVPLQPSPSLHWAHFLPLPPLAFTDDLRLITTSHVVHQR